MIDIEIDGKKINARPGASIIEIADVENIYIPRFCYHDKLTVAANCRMCLVEVDKVNKPLPACATPIAPNMKIFTRSKMAMDAQRAVMEYLLINHPLDCPICDQGGECELQDLAMGYGVDHSDYEQKKRAVLDEDLGSLVATGMTRCIQCTRCVRFGDEIAGMPELGATGRGEKMRIGTYVKHLMQSELSGNVIDLCPVGALISKPYLYSARSWELQETSSIAPHDCLGSNIFIHSRGQEYAPQRSIMRVVPRRNETVNEIWLSDRDRFSYTALEHEDRILEPRIKRDGAWTIISWQEALIEMMARLNSIVKQNCPEQVAALISPSATVEECYLLQKWLRALGSPHIDHRLRLQDFSDQDDMLEFMHLKNPITAINNLQAILILGADIRSEQPLLLSRMLQAAKRGANLMSINPVAYDYPFALMTSIIDADIITQLAQVVAVFADQLPSDSELAHIQPSEQAKAIAIELQQAGAAASIFIGDFAFNHPSGAIIRALLRRLIKLTGCNVIVNTEGANSVGAWLAGAVPHRQPGGTPIKQAGKNTQALLTHELRKAYILLGVELEFDSSYPATALSALQQAEFVVCMNVFATEKMLEYADLILPITPFTENAGTLVNMMGTWQPFIAASRPYGQAKPAWKIIHMLAKLMNLEGFAYHKVNDITHELKELITNNQPQQTHVIEERAIRLPAIVSDQLIRFAPWPIYRIDAYCRRAKPLQNTFIQEAAAIVVHPSIATALQVIPGDQVIAKQDQQHLCLTVQIDERLAPNVVLLPSGLSETSGFGQAYESISLERVIP